MYSSGVFINNRVSLSLSSPPSEFSIYRDGARMPNNKVDTGFAHSHCKFWSLNVHWTKNMQEWAIRWWSFFVLTSHTFTLETNWNRRENSISRGIERGYYDVFLVHKNKKHPFQSFSAIVALEVNSSFENYYDRIFCRLNSWIYIYSKVFVIVIQFTLKWCIIRYNIVKEKCNRSLYNRYNWIDNSL